MLLGVVPSLAFAGEAFHDDAVVVRDSIWNTMSSEQLFVEGTTLMEEALARSHSRLELRPEAPKEQQELRLQARPVLV